MVWQEAWFYLEEEKVNRLIKLFGEGISPPLSPLVYLPERPVTC